MSKPPAVPRTFRLDFAPLRAVRRSRELSQEQLARAAGVHRITLSRMEHNHTEPTVGQLVACARELGEPMHRLFTVVEVK